MRRLKPINGFSLFSRRVSVLAGSPYAFVASVVLIVVWGVFGPFCGYNETWQLVVNTTTTIITFLMVFLLQGTQNADYSDIHAKLDQIKERLDRLDERQHFD
jgi:low affinity Fe/Cu permease